MLKVAVVGASGYAGGELIRLIENHPELNLITATANSNVGEKVGSLNPSLNKYADLVMVETHAKNLVGHDVIFLALPHTKSAEIAEYLPESALVLDCGADFRLESAEQFEKFYGAKHAGTWVYGMPELILNKTAKQRDLLSGANRIAVPGCNATAITLAYAPLIAAGLIDVRDLVSTLSVGTSGAGRNAAVNTAGLSSAYAYQVGGSHRHIPEVLQNLQRLVDAKVSLTFTPVLVPMFRGILAVNTASVLPGVTEQAVIEAFKIAYKNESVIEIRPAGHFPDTKGSEEINKVQIGIALDQESNRVVVITALDNLVKGTAGAAIQCMNIALGFAEDLGLDN